MPMAYPYSSSTPYKRRSPPTSRGPSPSPPSSVDRSSTFIPAHSMASSTLYSFRRPPPRSSPPPYPLSNPNGVAVYGGSFTSDPEALELGESSGPQGGPFAYSTTLRRQVSNDHGFPPLAGPSHPHRKRTASNDLLNGRATHGHREGFLGTLDRISESVRKVVRRGGYQRVDQDDRGLDERRNRETPSAIYAHRSTEVTPFPAS